MTMEKVKISDVRDFWNKESCGERYLKSDGQSIDYDAEETNRYSLEPYIKEFAKFDDMHGRIVLEVGVGMGCDHLQIAKSEPSSLHGIDLTDRAISHTRARLSSRNYDSNLSVDSAENLSFEDNKFDVVYSWGALHHSENPQKCFDEVRRVLKPGGVAKIMIYNKYSLTGFYLWIKYGFLTGRLNKSMREIYANHLESPGTKAYTLSEAKFMFREFDAVDVKIQLSFGDLLLGEVGERHQGLLLSIGRKLLPRLLLKMVNRIIPIGLYLLIIAKK